MRRKASCHSKLALGQKPGRLKRCLEPGQAGTVAVRFTIRADGSVGNPSIKESTMQSAPMEQCLLEQLETLQFPAPEGGGIVMVRYPLRFSASRPSRGG